MASLRQMHRCVKIAILELIIIMTSVQQPGSAPEGESTAGSFGQSITLICNMHGRTNGYQMMWFYVDSESYISRNDRLFPTLDEDRLNRYSAWLEPDLQQYMLRIDGLLIRDGGKYVCGYNDRMNSKLVPLWETTLVVFQPPEDNTLACDVTYLDTQQGEERELEVSCSWNIELLNVDIAMYQGRTHLAPDLEFNGKIISRIKVAQFTRLNNFRCVMVHPDQNRQSAQCSLPQRDGRPVVHIQPLRTAVNEGTSTEFTCQTQNQRRRANIIWTPNCSDSPTMDVCKRITLVNGGQKLRIANPHMGDDGMLVQCSVLVPNGLMAAGVAQIKVDPVASTAGDSGLKGEHGTGTDRGWTNQWGRSGTIPVTTLEAEPIIPTEAVVPEAGYSNQSVYATIIPIVVVIVLLILLGYTCLSRIQTVYRRRQRKQSSEPLDDHLFQQDNSRLSRERVMDVVRSIPKLLYKARRSTSLRGKTAARRPQVPVTTAWASRGSIPRPISPIAIIPDLYRTNPSMMPAPITTPPLVPPPKPYPKLGYKEEAHYQNTGPLRQVEVPRIDPKLIMNKASKRYDFVRMSNDIARGYTNLRIDAAPPRRCSFTEDDFGYLVKSPRRTQRRDL